MIERKPMIVVIHENLKALEALERLLGGQDYVVATFTSMFRSVEYINRNRPDLILAQRPEAKARGLEFLETMKRISPTSEAFFLPAPLDVNAEGPTLRQGQADEVLRIVDRLLGVMVLPEPRRVPHTRSLNA
ncbi:MAG: hypothetical protein JO332_09770 [Planctomycetaceae bacterium]|nr:hypothetical protein [Planctomycetaceae bacterium]